MNSRCCIEFMSSFPTVSHGDHNFLYRDFLMSLSQNTDKFTLLHSLRRGGLIILRIYNHLKIVLINLIEKFVLVGM